MTEAKKSLSSFDDESVTNWFANLKNGREDAVNRLYNHFFEKLVRVGQKQYRNTFAGTSCPVEDEEDAALSALNTFVAKVRRGEVEDIAHCDQLWGLLVTITIRKVYRQRERANAKARGGGAYASDDIDGLVSELPGPEVVAELADTYRTAMAAIEDDSLRSLAAMELEGRTRPEMAAATGYTERTVYRKLQLIHKKWDTRFADATR